MKETLSELRTALDLGWNWNLLSRTAKPTVWRDLMLRSGFKASIDWIEFCVTLQSPSQFRHVQARLLDVWGKLYVTPVDGPASSSSFIFKVQDPIGPDQFMRDLQAMALLGEPPITENDVKVTGIEVALDAYVPGSDRQMLAMAGTYFLRYQAHPPEGNPRITADEFACEAGTLKEIFESFMDYKSSINCGPEGADRTCRFYLKDYNTRDGVSYKPLRLEQYSARFENTLRGKAVPFTTVAGWRKYRFERDLADLFALVVVDSKCGSFISAMNDHRLQLGQRPDQTAAGVKNRRKRAAFTRRDSKLNDRIRQSLRALTRAQRRENSVNTDLPDDLATLGKSDGSGTTPKYCITSTGADMDLQTGKEVLTGDQSLLTTAEESSSPTLDSVSMDGKKSNSRQSPLEGLNQLSRQDAPQNTLSPKSQVIHPWVLHVPGFPSRR